MHFGPGCLITSSRLRGNKKRRQGFYDKPNHLRQNYPMKNVWPKWLSNFLYEFLTTDNSLDPVYFGGRFVGFFLNFEKFCQVQK